MHGGLIRGVVPDPKQQEEQADRLKKVVTRQRKALRRKDRQIEERVAELEILRKQRQREHKLTETIKQQRLELFRLRNELDATNGLTQNAKDVSLADRASDKPGLPDFVIVGAQKSGTSLLYRLLTRHPLVEPAATKELHFFDNNFSEGLSWYGWHFPHRKYKGDRKTVSGEATPSYLFDPLVPERMAKTVPDAKLIALLRNPVTGHTLNTRCGEAGCGGLFLQGGHQAGDGGREEGRVPRRGLYAEQLERFAYFADRDYLLVMKSEDFFSRRWHAFGRALEFLTCRPSRRSPCLPPQSRPTPR